MDFTEKNSVSTLVSHCLLKARGVHWVSGRKADRDEPLVLNRFHL